MPSWPRWPGGFQLSTTQLRVASVTERSVGGPGIIPSEKQQGKVKSTYSGKPRILRESQMLLSYWRKSSLLLHSIKKYLVSKILPKQSFIHSKPQFHSLCLTILIFSLVLKNSSNDTSYLFYLYTKDQNYSFQMLLIYF